jgi:hypothetical protein
MRTEGIWVILVIKAITVSWEENGEQRLLGLLRLSGILLSVEGEQGYEIY